MKEILNQLNEVGVHCIISDKQVILEILENNLKQSDQMDDLIHNLLTRTENSNFNRVLLEVLQLSWTDYSVQERK